jgi:hypothetical protein
MTATKGPGSSRWVFFRRVGWIMALLAGLVVALAEIGAASGGRAPSLSATGNHWTPAVRTFAQALDEAQVMATTKARWVTIARDNTIVVLNSWDFRLIPILRQDNPRVQVWVYKDLSGVRSDDCTTANGDCGGCAQGVMDSSYLSSGMGYCWVKRYHPDWLLRAADTGQPLQFKSYPPIRETDYGSLAYQRQWARNVIADVREHGWDGVEVDNALTTAGAYGVAAKYLTNGAVQAATYSALREVGATLRDAGVVSVFNVGYPTSFPGLWQRWLGAVDGLEQEFYLSYSTQPDAIGGAWSTYEDEISSCAVRHKSCWFHSGEYSTAVTSQTRAYALASYLLAADGQQLLAVGNTTSGPAALRWALGAPVNPMIQTGAAWRRYFVRGIAVANPSTSRSVVPLGGSYLDDSGHPVSTVTLGPASGVVLRASPGQAAANGAP